MIDERRLYQALGDKVKKLRESQAGTRGRMTQSELADLVGLERTSITNIERGNQKVPLHVLFRICEVLRASVSDALPSVADIQIVKQQAALEDVSLSSETVKVTPLVKQAVTALLNTGK
ncbi:helix-turn-helix transcriptional regulator [Variovorax sp. LjRoot290]|uniref:helix-turn-helix domain-containing protein n=1 Tax=Variovorax sp. LjRoot290 TaxID=3342316 RepID=UPI003ECCF5D0